LSSILRALKKLEDKPPQRKDLQAWQQDCAVKKSLRSKKGDRPLLIFIAIICTAGIMTAAAFFLYFHKKAPQKTAAFFSAKMAEQTTPPDRQNAKKPVGPTTRRRIVPRSTKSRSEKRIERTDDKALGQRQVLPKPSAPVQSVTPPPETVGITGVIPEQTTPPIIPLVDNPRLKLQAVSWSEIPEKRLAVISNHIVREGESIEGYSLVAINMDDVVVGKRGETWRLTFK